MVNINTKKIPNSILELTNLVDQYKQDIFWKSQDLKIKYDNFYKKQDKYALYILSDYKLLGYIDINEFLYNRKSFFEHFRKNLFVVIDSIFADKKKIDKDDLKKGIINNVYYGFYKIIKSITVLDDLFMKAPTLDETSWVYRGMNFLDPYMEQKLMEKLRKLEKGDEIIFENYLSTSLTNYTAMDFISSQFTNKVEAKCCLFKIKIPKSQRVLYLDSNLTGFHFLKQLGDRKESVTISEYEILLPRSSRLKFVKTFTIAGKVPYSCTLQNLKKGDITDILVYQFDFVGVDKNREKFDDEKSLEQEYMKEILKDLNYVDLEITKYDLNYYSKLKDTKTIIRKFDKESQKRYRQIVKNKFIK